MKDRDPKAFLQFVAGILKVPAKTLSLASAYGSIPEWDSVMHLRLILEIGEAYGVEFPVDEIVGIRTLGDFHRRILATRGEG